jgi:hypothetical protein
VVCAYATLSGFSLGRWATRACCYAYSGSASKILCHSNGTAWTSRYFREKYYLGRWATRARCYAYNGSASKIFCHSKNGIAWTSRYFREKYLYPSLRSQQAAGDALLNAFASLAGSHSLAATFWCARTQVTRGGRVSAYRFRKATIDQVYEHGRWERKRSGERIDVIYREWTTRDRVKITFYCQ